MAYSNTIDSLKAALNSYSAEEEKLSRLYSDAIQNAEKAYKEALKQSDEQYKRDRNTVYADNAQAERNYMNTIAARGLGFSGEATQAKLNSNITLANRLSALEREKYRNDITLDQELETNRTNLSLEEAEKLKDLIDGRNGMQFDIASLELEKEQNDAQLQAEKEANAAKLQAEKEMLQMELDAKYGGTSGGNGSSGGNGGNGGGSGAEAETEAEEESTANGFVPNITAKELAKQLINTATEGSNYVNSEKHKYLVNKYLLELNENYGIDRDYLDDLLFMLRVYGYEESSIPQMRIDVITYDAIAYYYDACDEYYDKYTVAGMKESRAKAESRKIAANKQIDYIYKQCRNILEFEQCCKAVGISDAKMQEYLSSIDDTESEAVIGGSKGGYAVRSPK